MINDVKKQIENILGSDFRLYWNTAHQDIASDVSDTDKPNVAIGVCYNTYGTRSAIENSQAMEYGMAIEFLIPSEKAKYDAFERKIDSLAETTNAQYRSIVYDSNGEEIITLNYVMIFNVQKAVSDEELKYGCYRQRILLDVKITASPDLAFGNSRTIEVKLGGMWNAVENLINAQIYDSVESTPRVDLNNFVSTNEAQYSAMRLQATYLYKNNSTLHTLFEGHRLNGVNAVYEMRYTQNGQTIAFLGQILTYSHANPTGGFQAVDIVFVRANEEEAATSYTLSLSPVPHSTITITRYGITLNSGDTIYANDELIVSATASSGYTLTSLKANNVSIVSGAVYVVSGNTTITTTVEQGSVTTYILTLNQGNGSILTVTSGGTALSSGAIIQQGQVLTVSAVGATGYNVTSITVNGVAVTSGTEITVGDNILVNSTAAVAEYTLTANITVPSGIQASEAHVCIYRVGTINGATIEELILDSANAIQTTVHYGDILKYHYEITTTNAFKMTAFTVNGQTILNDGQATAVSDTILTATLGYIDYTLSFSSNGADIYVFRNMVALENGATIHYYDVLQIQAEVQTGYRLDNVTINGTIYNTATPPNQTVHGNMVITASVYSNLTTIDQTGEIWSMQRINYGASTPIPAGATPFGWSFTSWNTRSDGSGQTYTPGTSYSGKDLTLYAQGVYTKPTVYIRATTYKVSATAGYGIRVRAYTASSGGLLVNVASTITATVEIGNLGTKYYAILNGNNTYASDGLAETAAEIGSVSVTAVSPTSDSTYDYSF